jgi:hypothetical protein
MRFFLMAHYHKKLNYNVLTMCFHTKHRVSHLGENNGADSKLHGKTCQVWYGMVWYGMVWYGMVWYGMVWYGMVWYKYMYIGLITL